MEKASGDTHWISPVCRERVRCPLPHPSGDGRDQPFVLLTTMSIIKCGPSPHPSPLRGEGWGEGEREVCMPRREKDHELARRRKRRKERKKLRAKGLLPPSPEAVKEKEVVKKKPEKAPPKEAPQEAPKEGPKETIEPKAPEG